jgi:hypothetical protein
MLLICSVAGAMLSAVGTFGMFQSNIGFGGLAFIVFDGVDVVFIKQTPN